MEGHLKTAVAPGAAVDVGYHHPLTEGAGDLFAAAHLQFLTGGDRRAAALSAQPGLVVQVALVTQAGIKRPALRRRVARMAVARRQVVIPPVVRLAISGAVAPADIDAEAHLRRRVAVVIVPGEHRLRHHAMPAFQRPHRLGTAVVLAGRRHRRQNQPLPVVPLVVVKLHHVNVQPGVGGEAEPDTHLTQQAGDKAQVVLAVLHHLLAPRVRLRQREDKVLPAHAVAGAQDMLHDIRHRHILVNPVLVAPGEQRQTRLQGQGIMRFVPGGGKALKRRHHALNRAYRLPDFYPEALVNRGLQGEGGILHQHLLRREGFVGAGEFNLVAERFAQGLIAFKGQHVQQGAAAAHR
ncbi:Uncharacterised protein [Klebsiella oxytoca]|nr:Uncharacterised protein [Klebsiella oxytoca]